MYIAISKWEFDPTQEELVKEKGNWMLSQIRGWDGVEVAQNVRTSPGSVMAIIGYRDAGTRDKLILAEDGPFNRALQESGLGELAKWVWTEEGEAL